MVSYVTDAAAVLLLLMMMMMMTTRAVKIIRISCKEQWVGRNV